jgi:hypothetical protein
MIIWGLIGAAAGGIAGSFKDPSNAELKTDKEFSRRGTSIADGSSRQEQHLQQEENRLYNGNYDEREERDFPSYHRDRVRESQRDRDMDDTGPTF